MSIQVDEQRERDAVACEALSWYGTPYHHHARIKGVGVDCAQLLCVVYETCGLLPHVNPGFYPHDHHLHRTEEIYIQWLERCGAREVPQPGVGDVALYHWGKTWSHGGIVVGEQTLLHAYLGHSVRLTRFNEAPLAGRSPRFWSLW